MSRADRDAVLVAVGAATGEVLRIEAELAEALAHRDALIRAAREARCTIPEIQSVTALSRPHVNRILVRAEVTR